MIMLIASFVVMPLFVPIGAANGITVAQPISSRRFARTGSAFMYGRTLKPSFISISAARNVSTGSGSR